MEYRLPQNRPVSDLVPFPVFKHFIIQLALCFKNFNHGIWNAGFGQEFESPVHDCFRAISSKSVSHGDCLPFLTASLRLLFLQYVLWALHRILQHRKSRLQIVASKKITTFSEYIGFVDDSATGTFCHAELVISINQIRINIFYNAGADQNINFPHIWSLELHFAFVWYKIPQS